MDIHDIKPPGGDGPFIGSDAQPVDDKRQNTFADVKSKVETPGTAEPATPALGIVAQTPRSALDDPEKLEAVVRASVSELVDANRNITGPLSSAHKQSLVDFLSADPMFRRQVETYLRKALG